MKSKIFISCVFVIILSIVCFVSVNRKQNTLSSSESLVGIYIQDGDTYKSVKTIPTSGYFYNSSKSYCKNKNGETNIAFNYILYENTISLLPSRDLKCYLYFDEALNLDISLGSIEISEGSQSDTLYISGGGLETQIEASSSQPIAITGSTTSNEIFVSSGSANIILNNVNMDGDFRIFGTANLTLEGENNCNSGILLRGSLTIGGNGVLNATGVVGIGYNMGSMGSLTINSGTVNATGTDGAGIGGNGLAFVEINGGTVNAISNGYGAGIGGNRNQSIGGTIQINGGTVYAHGGYYAAGIGGGGQQVTSCNPATTAPNIYISDNANVTAIAGDVLQDWDTPADDIGNGGFSC